MRPCRRRSWPLAPSHQLPIARHRPSRRRPRRRRRSRPLRAPEPPPDALGDRLCELDVEGEELWDAADELSEAPLARNGFTIPLR